MTFRDFGEELHGLGAQRQIVYTTYHTQGRQDQRVASGIIGTTPDRFGVEFPSNPPCNHAETQSAVRLPCGQMWLLSRWGHRKSPLLRTAAPRPSRGNLQVTWRICCWFKWDRQRFSQLKALKWAIASEGLELLTKPGRREKCSRKDGMERISLLRA